ncbi:MAG: DUF342 domain-containing protein [Leptospiraceae bacterium]|nr:DUF342 domain-containing protein [Leptospiraceae bacterium]
MTSTDDLLRDIEENENGHFLVERQAGQAMLRVYPAGKKGESVKTRDVLARLELFQLQGYDRGLVEEIVERADGQGHLICPWPEPDAVDARIHIDIAPDKMSAYVEIEPPHHGGQEATADGIRAELQAAGVTTGIDEQMIDRLAAGEALDQAGSSASESTVASDSATRRPGQKPIYTPVHRHKQRALIASGQPPRPGRHGKIKHYFNPNPRAAPYIADPDKPSGVDFRELNVIQTCKAGQLLAEVLPPEPGHVGYDVTGGAILPPTSETAAIIGGENTRTEADDAQIFATCDGQVRIQLMEEGSDSRARFEVREVLQLENVDYSTGHVEFPGTVIIAGTVLDGFAVRADGDILIEKSVGNVRLQAGGDIVLTGGAVCRNTGYIQAEGSVFARFIQDASVFARQGILIEEVSMHSRLVAGETIVIEGGRGELIGGTVVCGHTLRCQKIGSRMEANTTIHVGIDPDVLERLRTIEDEYEEKHKTLVKVDTQLRQLEEAQRRGRAIEEHDQANMQKLQLIRDKYTGIIQSLDQQRIMLYNNIQPADDAQVIANDALYPGVEVHFGSGVKRYRVEGRPIFAYSRFVLEDGRIYLRHSNI